MARAVASVTAANVKCLLWTVSAYVKIYGTFSTLETGRDFIPFVFTGSNNGTTHCYGGFWPKEGTKAN